MGAQSLLLPVFCLSLISLTSKGAHGIDKETYLRQRKDLLQEEHSRMLGSDIILSPEEEMVNNVLMSYKDEEMQSAFATLNFPPSKSFLIAKDQIDQSPVFSIIKDMPKGAALHIHDSAMVQIDWVVSELTYWEDLYMCNQSGSPLLFKFFETPDEACPWELVSSTRAAYSDPQVFDRLLMESMSMIAVDPDEYTDINALWHAFEETFVTTMGLISYAPAWEKYLNRALYEFTMDNVVYLELRGSVLPLYEKNGKIFSKTEGLNLYEKVVHNFTCVNSEDFFGAKYIYETGKRISVEEMWSQILLMLALKTAFPDTVVGFDLVGQEDPSRPLIDYVEPLLYLSNQDPPIPVFYHAGETNWHGMPSDENLIDAFLLNATRIGHGYAIAKHPSLLQRARDKNIAVEVCPISHQVLMLVDDLRNHPMAALASDGFPIVVSSDGHAKWGADPLSHDFYEAFYALGGAKADLKFLKKLALNSIEFSSLTTIGKQALQRIWQTKWDEFILSTIRKQDGLKI